MTNCTHPNAGVQGSFGPEKAAELLTPRHLELIRAAQQAIHRVESRHSSTAEQGAALADWQAAAERLAVALVSRLETIEEARHDSTH